MLQLSVLAAPIVRKKRRQGSLHKSLFPPCWQGKSIWMSTEQLNKKTAPVASSSPYANRNGPTDISSREISCGIGKRVETSPPARLLMGRRLKTGPRTTKGIHTQLATFAWILRNGQGMKEKQSHSACNSYIVETHTGQLCRNRSLLIPRPESSQINTPESHPYDTL